MWFDCPSPVIGKFYRQRLGEKRKEVFYSKAAQSGRMAGSCLRAHSFQKTQRKIHHPLPEQFQAVPRVPSPIQNSVLQELGSCWDILQAVQLLFLLWSSDSLLFRATINHRASRASQPLKPRPPHREVGPETLSAFLPSLSLYFLAHTSVHSRRACAP